MYAATDELLVSECDNANSIVVIIVTRNNKYMLKDKSNLVIKIYLKKIPHLDVIMTVKHKIDEIVGVKADSLTNLLQVQSHLNGR